MAIALQVALLVLGFVFLDIHRDEAMIGEHAYWFAKDGFVKSTLARGLGLDWENHLLHYHKLLVYFGAMAINIGSFSVHVLRVVPLVFAVVFYVSYIRFLKIRENYNHKWIVLALFILSFNYLFYSATLVFRPEILVLTFGFLSYSCLVRYHSTKKIVQLILASVLVALAAMSHLNGIAFGFAGLFFLLVYRNWKQSIVFTLLSVAFFLPYFWNMWSSEGVLNWLLTIQSDPNLAHDGNVVSQLFFRLLNEHTRWFRNPQIALFFVLFFAVVIFKFKSLWTNSKGLMVYTLSLIVFIAILSYSKSTKYAIVYFPFMVLVILKVVHVKGFLRGKRHFVTAFLALFLLVNLIYAAVYWKHNAIDTTHRNEAIEEILMQGNIKNVLGDETLIFQTIEKQNLHMPYVYSVLHKDSLNLNVQTSFFQFAKSNLDEMVVIDKHRMGKNFFSDLHIDNLAVGDEINNYQLMLSDKDVFAFKRILNSEK